MAIDLDDYASRAELFTEELEREYYLHLSGRKPDLDLEPIYERHASLFELLAAERLREAASGSAGEARRRALYLLHFGLDGLLGRETRHEAAELARLEASLQVETAGGTAAYRSVPIALANEPDGARRAELETARDAILTERLDPLYRQALERSHELVRSLGWRSYRDAYAELRGIDFEGLSVAAGDLLAATDAPYAALVDPQLAAAGVPDLGELSRSDLPRLFRAPALDARFPADRLVPSLADTMSGLGIDLGRQSNVHLDVDSRPTKSARAFCSTPRVPDEVHLVIAPSGGRDDYAALFHEGGHTEHYANVDADLPFEFRQLGDNSVTESFAFLFEHLTWDGEWLRARLGVSDPEPIVAHARASRLVMLRRYAAKIDYELELHGPGPRLDRMPHRYAELLGGATRVRWPLASWLADVDPGFYVACYLRAWALEVSWRAALRDRFGARWFDSPAAGEWLRELWRQGQRLGADELLAATLGRRLDLSELSRDVAAAAT